MTCTTRSAEDTPNVPANRSLSKFFSPDDGRFPSAVVALLLLSVLSILLGASIFGFERLAFRDLSHFDQPLYEYLDQRCTTTSFPLWSSLEQFGVPLAGETTTGLFYPFRVLFLLPLGRDARITLFIFLHLFLAGLGTLVFCRTRGSAAIPSAIAAITYPLSGPIFFLYTNPPFLVGACWLPWILSALLRSATAPSRRAVASGALAMALAILGGDPQIPFHAVLVVAAYTVFITAQQSQAFAAGSVRHFLFHFLARLHRNLVPLGLCILLAWALAAPQLFASHQWSRQSWRAATAEPSLWSSHSSTGDRIVDSVPSAELVPHTEDVYRFSIAPWHTMELLWPFISGRLAPSNERWMDSFAAEPATWTPTLYCGLLAPACFFLMLVHRRWNRLEWWLAVFGIAGALGSFSLGYAFRALSLWTNLPPSEAISDPAGGFYWALIKLVPGYGQFRYPAKWLPLAAIGLTALTAACLSQLDRKTVRTLAAILLSIGLASGLFAALSFAPQFIAWGESCCQSPRVRDPFWGPVKLDALLGTVRKSLIQSSVLAILFMLGTLGMCAQRCPLKLRALCCYGLVLAVGIEMFFVASWQLITLPANLAPQTADAVTKGEAAPRFLLRSGKQPWPASWSTDVATKGRLAAVEDAQHSTWFQRWHLPSGATVVNSPVALPPASVTFFWRLLEARLSRLPANERLAALAKVAGYLSLDAILIREVVEKSTEPHSQLVRVPSPLEPRSAILQWYPRYARLDPDRSVSELFLEDLLERILSSPSLPLPTVLLAGTEHGEAAKSPASLLSPAAIPHKVRILAMAPESIHVELDTSTSGLLRFLQYQDGNWHVRYRDWQQSLWKDAEVVPVDFIGQGVLLAAGHYEVEFYYRPWWWGIGWLCSSLGLCAALGMFYRGRGCAV